MPLPSIPHLQSSISLYGLRSKLAKRRWTTNRNSGPNSGSRQRPRNLFSCLLKCGACGGGVRKVSSKRYGCSGAHKKAICENHLIIKQDYLEHTTLDALQNHLMDKALLKVFCEEYTNHINELRRTRNANNRLQKELAKLADSKQKIIEAIKGGIPASEVKDDLDAIIAQRTEIETSLEEQRRSSGASGHPNMAARYHREVAGLIKELHEEGTRAETADLLARPYRQDRTQTQVKTVKNTLLIRMVT